MGEYIEDFRIYMQTLGSPSVRLTWWTTNFGTMVCRDTLTVLCGLRAPDTLYTRRTTVSGDTCCRDFLLINSHQPRSPLKRFRLAMNTPNASFSAPTSLPDGWSMQLNGRGDTALFVIDSLLAPGDTVIFPGICFDNDLSPEDQVRYTWITEFEDLIVTIGTGSAPCFREIIFCDSVSALVDSSLTATQRCITLNVGNRNSRRDTIKRFTVRIDNPGTRLRILNAQAPPGWSIDRVTPDSVTFHRGTIDPGFNKEFEFCLNIDTNARDPLTITWTTWADNFRPICTEEIPVRVDLRLSCDSAAIGENSGSIDPLCCFDVTFYNFNGKERPIDLMTIRVPRSDLIIDTAEASGSWRLGSDFFPSIFVEYVGDTLRAGDSVTFSFCVDARVSPDRPIDFDVLWQTFSRGELLCFGTERVVCEGSPGRCDSISLTSDITSELTCQALSEIRNVHTPDGPINNVQYTILQGNVDFRSAVAEGSASGFDQVTLDPRQVIFKGGTIPAGGTAGPFRLEFAEADEVNVIIETCTFEDDTELCCEIDTVECSFLGVDDQQRGEGALVRSVMPNPSSGETTVRYRTERTGSATLVLLDAEGREIRRYEEGMQGAGEHEIMIDGRSLPSGLYYFILHAGGEKETGKLILVK